MKSYVSNDEEHICITTEQGVCEVDFSRGVYADVVQKEFDLDVSVPVWWFTRLRVRPEFWRKGHGRELMQRLCEIADERNIAIFNAPNPHGNRDMESLIRFFEASGFQVLCNEECNHALLRLPKGSTS